MAESKRKAYLNTATGAIRQSSTALGFPYIEAPAAEVRQLPKAGESAEADADAKPTKASGGK